MKIILHMGQGKTGTTSLQQTLHAAASTLRQRGILYPHFGRRATTALCALTGLSPALAQITAIRCLTG